MRRALAGAVVAVVMTGCGNTGAGGTATDGPEPEESVVATPSPSEETSGASEPTSQQPSQEPSDDDAIEVEIEGDQIAPNGRRVKVSAGEPITLEVESDRPGAFHVHSSPEQEIAFEKGETTVEFTVETPGVVDVEEHEAGIVVLQLEVG